MENKGDAFLGQCRISYFKKITPANRLYFNTEEYLKLAEIAKAFFKEGKIEEFSGFFREGHYFVQLWAAHLILEFGQPANSLKKQCIDIIIEYSNHPIDHTIAVEEQNWLKENSELIKNTG